MQARPRPEAHHGEVRQPRTRLPPVDTESLEPLLHLAGERGGVAGDISEDQHRDAPRLSIPIELELDIAARPNRLLQRSDDLCELGLRPGAEEGKRDVEVLSRDDSPSPPELTLLPWSHAVEYVLGKLQGEEESQPLISLQATRRTHTSS